MSTYNDTKSARNIIFLLVILAAILAYIAFFRSNGSSQSQATAAKSTLDTVKSSKVIRVGYEPYPPYVDKDLNTGQMTGYSVDVMSEIASQMGVKIKYIEGSFGTDIPDLKTGKFDLFIGPLFATIPRVEEIEFPTPYGYFAGVAGVTRKSENRFTKIEDLNREGITIAVPQGWVAHEYATKYLSKATIKPFKQEGTALVLADVLAGNSIVALADGPTVQQYIEKNKDQDIKPLFLDNPPVIVPAGFGIKAGDPQWLQFLSSTVEILRADGTLAKIASKYKLYSFDIERKYVPQ